MITNKISCNDFSYEYIENIVDNNNVVFVYFYNYYFKNQLKEIMNQNIKDVQNLYNPNITILVNVNDVNKIENVIGHNIKLPTILVFENKEISEFLIDTILIQKD